MAASKPTSSLSMITDTFHPLTLDQYFGTLTVVWVVPLSRTTFTPARRLLSSTMLEYSEFDWEPISFET